MMNYDGNLELNRVRLWFASVLTFLMFVPGTVMLLFGIGQTLVLPSSVIESLYPYLTPFPERFLLVTISETIPAIGRITFEDFAAVDVFVQQVFVVAFLCSILFAATLIMQVCAGALYPGLHNFSIVSPLTMSLGMLCLRELQVFFLIGKSSPAGRAEAVHLC
ncbi:MAG: hypothetical protein AB7I42_27440 [Bradyrhizobium sp.]|uniref:hypothetical protein n=2 Tax=Bradyrhizobium sp. TaxID=376 RepID=UPI003D0E4AA1